MVKIIRYFKNFINCSNFSGLCWWVPIIGYHRPITPAQAASPGPDNTITTAHLR